MDENGPSNNDGSGDDVEDELDEEELKTLTVKMLKQRLKKKNLKVSGRKAELVDRLMGQEEKSTTMCDPGDDETNDRASAAAARRDMLFQ
jgi:choline kinase